MSEDLLLEIREFLRESGMGPSYFGKAACGNSELVRRLEDPTRRVWPDTAARVRRFIAKRRQHMREAAQ